MCYQEHFEETVVAHADVTCPPCCIAELRQQPFIYVAAEQIKICIREIAWLIHFIRWLSKNKLGRTTSGRFEQVKRHPGVPSRSATPYLDRPHIEGGYTIVECTTKHFWYCAWQDVGGNGSSWSEFLVTFEHIPRTVVEISSCTSQIVMDGWMSDREQMVNELGW